MFIKQFKHKMVAAKTYKNFKICTALFKLYSKS